MFESNFDPLKELETLKLNQHQLFENQQLLQLEHKKLLDQLKDQEKVIDVLIKGLEANNISTQQMLSQWVNQHYSTGGNH